MKAIGKATKAAREAIKAYLYNNNLINKRPKITNSTCTDVIFEGAQSSKMVAKKQDCHSIAPAYKQINEEMAHQTSPRFNPINRKYRDILYKLEFSNIIIIKIQENRFLQRQKRLR